MNTEPVSLIEHRQRLERLLATFPVRPQEVCGALMQWYRTNRDELSCVAIQQLGSAAEDRALLYLGRLLVSNSTYMKYLLDPGNASSSEAIGAARLLAKNDPKFCQRLVAAADEAASNSEVVNRAFEIVTALDRVCVVVPWLQRMTRHPDPRVQSKASLIFCRLYANPHLVERQLTSTDPRVRANAIEALWRVNKPTCRAILEKAVNDPHHRVALNAALGLYFLNPLPATQQMMSFAARPSPAFRAAAAWAMGQTGDPAVQQHLEVLAADPAENVRSAAQRALSKLSEARSAGVSNSAPEPAVSEVA